MIEEEVINGHDNTIDLILKADDVAQSLVSVTKVELVDRAGNLDTISSEDDADYFTWLNTGETGKLIMNLGGAGVTAGKYIFELIIYHPDYTNGIRWSDIIIEFKD